jgi:hypothetical protein
MATDAVQRMDAALAEAAQAWNDLRGAIPEGLHISASHGNPNLPNYAMAPQEVATAVLADALALRFPGTFSTGLSGQVNGFAIESSLKRWLWDGVTAYRVAFDPIAFSAVPTPEQSLDAFLIYHLRAAAEEARAPSEMAQAAPARVPRRPGSTQRGSCRMSMTVSDRISAVTDLDEALGRWDLAVHFATSTSLTIPQIKAALVTAPMDMREAMSDRYVNARLCQAPRGARGRDCGLCFRGRHQLAPEPPEPGTFTAALAQRFGLNPLPRPPTRIAAILLRPQPGRLSPSIASTGGPARDCYHCDARKPRDPRHVPRLVQTIDRLWTCPPSRASIADELGALDRAREGAERRLSELLQPKTRRHP